MWRGVRASCPSEQVSSEHEARGCAVDVRVEVSELHGLQPAARRIDALLRRLLEPRAALLHIDLDSYAIEVCLPHLELPDRITVLSIP